VSLFRWDSGECYQPISIGIISKIICNKFGVIHILHKLFILWWDANETSFCSLIKFFFGDLARKNESVLFFCYFSIIHKMKLIQMFELRPSHLVNNHPRKHEKTRPVVYL